MIRFHIGRGGWVLGWVVGGCTKWLEGGGGRGAIGEEGAPVVVFLQPSPCPLNLLGLVDDLSPPSAWPVVMVIAKVFQQFLFASSLNVQLKEVWLVLDNIKKDPTNQYWKCDWQKYWFRSHHVAQS